MKGYSGANATLLLVRRHDEHLPDPAHRFGESLDAGRIDAVIVCDQNLHLLQEGDRARITVDRHHLAADNPLRNVARAITAGIPPAHGVDWLISLTKTCASAGNHR